MESPLEDDKPKRARIVPTKGSYSKAKITVYNNEPATVVTELKAKVDVQR
jgi:hypothetical protein